MGKRGRNQITGKRIDGGATKECPSKLSPIKVEAAANNNSKSDVGGEPFKVKHRKKRSRSLTTDGVKYGGGKDSASGDDDEPVIKPSFDPEEVEKNDNRSAKEYKKDESAKVSRSRLKKCIPLPCSASVVLSSSATPMSFYAAERSLCKSVSWSASYVPQSASVEVSSLENEWFKIKTFDLRGEDGGSGGSNGGDTNGGVGGQGGGAGGVAK